MERMVVNYAGQGCTIDVDNGEWGEQSESHVWPSGWTDHAGLLRPEVHDEIAKQVAAGRKLTREDALRRWPRIVAHLISESLGYFCPRSAASAVAAAKNGEAYWCEWYMDWAYRQQGDRRENMLTATQQALSNAIRRRSHHKGYMADYQAARALVDVERGESGGTAGMLASWF